MRLLSPLQDIKSVDGLPGGHGKKEVNEALSNPAKEGARAAFVRPGSTKPNYVFINWIKRTSANGEICMFLN